MIEEEEQVQQQELLCPREKIDNRPPERESKVGGGGGGEEQEDGADRFEADQIDEAEKLKAEGNAFVKAGKFGDAIEKYRAAIDINPSEAAYHSNLSHCFYKMKRYAEMEAAARACVEVDDGFVKGYYRLGMSLKLQERYEDALQVLNKAIKLEPGNTDLKFIHAEVESHIQVNRCGSCGKPDAQMACAKCRVRYYCSKECQRSDWSTHRHLCRKDGDAHANCSFCLKKIRLSDALRCDRCNGEVYCSRECQKNDKPNHFLLCQNIALQKEAGLYQSKEDKLFLRWYESPASCAVNQLATHVMTKKQFLDRSPSFVVELEVQFSHNYIGFMPTGMPKVTMISELPENEQPDIKRRFDMYSSSVTGGSRCHIMMVVLKLLDGRRGVTQIRYQTFEPSQFRRLSLEDAMKQFRVYYGDASPKLRKALKPIGLQRIQAQFGALQAATKESGEWSQFYLNAYRFQYKKPLFLSHYLMVYFEVGEELGKIEKITRYEVMKKNEARKKPGIKEVEKDLIDGSRNLDGHVMIPILLCSDDPDHDYIYAIGNHVRWCPDRVIPKSAAKCDKEAQKLFYKLKTFEFPNVPPSPNLSDYDI